jgi:hypothetical protein
VEAALVITGGWLAREAAGRPLPSWLAVVAVSQSQALPVPAAWPRRLW